ncbi:mucin-5AC-like isoform X2 [Neocloeon triangulifer]|uniref:mucin-5AC-like isoform X2 n=1 Tax=Neocloeon triangulifer TaxID=2078957 RepID=UPI00286F55B2|nr:mucin-5AC-like isoform X2 [Neocloeon triangulifer]
MKLCLMLITVYVIYNTCFGIKIKTFFQQNGLLSPRKTRENRKLRRDIIVSCCGIKKCSKHFRNLTQPVTLISVDKTAKSKDLKEISPITKVISHFDTTNLDHVSISTTDLNKNAASSDTGIDNNIMIDLTTGTLELSTSIAGYLSGIPGQTASFTNEPSALETASIVSSTQSDQTGSISKSFVTGPGLIATSSTIMGTNATNSVVTLNAATADSNTVSESLKSTFSNPGTAQLISQTTLKTSQAVPTTSATSLAVSSLNTDIASTALATITVPTATATAIITTTTDTTATTTKTSTTTTTTPTTTTKPRQCQSSSCAYYKNASKALKSSSVSEPLGRYVIASSTMFFVTTALSTLNDAVVSCLRKSMAVIAVPTTSDMENYLKLWKKITGSTVNYWTSGANDGSSCEVEKVYTWCASNLTVAPDDVTMQKYWSIAKTFNATTDRCIAIQFNATSASIYFTKCASRMAYVCGPSCKQPTCPQTCKTNDSLFAADGSIKEPSKHGYFATICGIKYLFGNAIGTWRDNYEKCCSLGMAPIFIESAQEQTCLSKFTRNNWTYNFNYWTAGTQQGCRGRWSWCSGAGLLDLNDSLTWSSAQPDNKAGNEECLHMRLFQNSSGVVLSDRNCSDKYVIACKGQPKIPTCQQAKCPSYACEKKNSLFYADQLYGYSNYGSWFSNCGRTFLFSNSKANWSRAYNVCCSIGMTLLAVEYGDKHRCISNFVKISPQVNVDFWTSGTDKECDDWYRWCSIERDFLSRNVNWKSGEPNSNNGDCVSINFSNATANQSTFSVTNCSKELQFICEESALLPKLTSCMKLQKNYRCEILGLRPMLCKKNAWIFGMSAQLIC